LGDLAVLEEVARTVDLNSTEMIEHLESKYYAEAVIGQYREALQYGINGIPTFLVGNLMFTGAHPYNIFQTAMDRVLNPSE
jgi:predicted DsbA family dithiol-disulfide isomerase